MADQLIIAKENAESVLAKWESTSPELTAALSGLCRGVVVDMMAMTFLDGVKWGANELIGLIREERLRVTETGRPS